MLRVLAEARAEAIEAAAWYDREKFGLGVQLLNEIEQALDRIENDPQGFPQWEFPSGPDDIRRYVLKRFPYVVLFTIQSDETTVIAISHGRRRPSYWRDRLG
jgi:mRNA-degrading endonuclease RelE of RelBE toxin-antitoxin system